MICTLKPGPLLKQYVIVMVANLTFFQFGVTVGWMSPAVLKLRDPSLTPLPAPASETEAAWILSVSSLVALSALLYAGSAVEWLGRRRALLAAVLPRAACAVLLLLGRRVWLLLLARALCGVSDLFVITVVATYSSEIASSSVRGGLGAVSQISSAAGSMLLLCVGPYVSLYTLSTIQLVTIVVTSVPLLFLPESPYFLYKKGKSEEALSILTSLRGDAMLALEELKEYSENKVEHIPWKELVKDRVLLKALGLVVFLGVSSQLTGYNAVTFYLQTIFQSAGTSVAAEASSAVVGCVQVLACATTILLTDRFGRKPVLVITFFWCAVGLAGLGAFFKVRESGSEVSGLLNYLPLVSMLLVIFCFNAGIGALVWILMAELFPPAARARGVAAGAFTATLFTFLTIRYFAALAAAAGPAATYWGFSACCLLSCCLVGLLVPETKGKTFTQIQRDLARR